MLAIMILQLEPAHKQPELQLARARSSKCNAKLALGHYQFASLSVNLKFGHWASFTKIDKK